MLHVSRVSLKTATFEATGYIYFNNFLVLLLRIIDVINKHMQIRQHSLVYEMFLYLSWHLHRFCKCAEALDEMIFCL